MAGDLRAGPGHFADTPLPGRRGTVAIAGHRTTYGAPFRRLDALRRGDPITMTMPYGRFVYRVSETIIVARSQGMAVWREKLFVLMARNAVRATAFFRLPPERVVELGVQVDM